MAEPIFFNIILVLLVGAKRSLFEHFSGKYITKNITLV